MAAVAVEPSYEDIEPFLGYFQFISAENLENFLKVRHFLT